MPVSLSGFTGYTGGIRKKIVDLILTALVTPINF